MPHISKKIIIFDLDGTLAESKQPLDDEMASLLRELLRAYTVAVISGGFFEQYEKQFLSNLGASKEEMEKLVLLPTSGSTMYRYGDGIWQQVYCDEIEKNERERIIRNLHEAIELLNLKPETSWGELVEDRKTQITYSGLGQAAPLEEKKKWDPDKTKKKIVVAFLKERLEGYSIRMGGMTSVDITLPGIDKAYGIRKIEERLGVSAQEIVFVGDKLEEGGNDAPARTTGVECVDVGGPQETKAYIRSII